MTTNEILVLKELCNVDTIDVEDEFRFDEDEALAFPFNALLCTGLDRKIIRRACRSLARKGLAKCCHGLCDEDGNFRGSGYIATKAGASLMFNRLKGSYDHPTKT